MNDEAVIAFFERLDGLNSGERAALRREAGTMLKDAGGQAVRAFYRCLPYAIPQWQEEYFFAAACLHCLWDTGERGRSGMTQILYGLSRDENVSESTGHRLESLLDTKWDADGYMLAKFTRLVKLIKAKDYSIDCAELLKDIIHWNADGQWVQRKWARGMYVKPEEIKTAEEGE